jgi:two-component system response regulator HydG
METLEPNLNQSKTQTKMLDLNKATNHLRLLTELGHKLQSILTSENIYEEIVQIVQNKFHFYSFSIWSVGHDKSATLQAQSGAYNKFIQKGFVLKPNEGIVGTVIQTKKSYICNDVRQDPHFTSLEFEVETKSQLSCPVILNGEVVCVLTVESNKLNAFDEEDQITFESICGQLSISLANLKMYNEIKFFNKKLQETIEEKTRELKLAHSKILEQQKLLQKENHILKTLVEKENKAENDLIAHSPAIKNVIAMVDKIAPTNTTVLIQGESGTGKELIAKRLHQQSDRKDKPFIAINCGALQENLLESELFGHEKGAFTGAVSQKIGLAEMADGGTLFLDEIGELSLSIQAKLLRFLQEGEIYRVGGKHAIKVNVRIISATNRDLEKEVKEKKFREDLFYRLNTITIRVPPLRKRKEDIRPLIDYFLKNPKIGGKFDFKKVDEAVYEILTQYDWPGNIRELQNTIERIKILAEHNEIRIDDIPNHIRLAVLNQNQNSNTDEINFSADKIIQTTLEDLEKRHIKMVLAYHQGNKTKAAQTLGITIKTLYNKLHRYGELTESESNLPS